MLPFITVVKIPLLLIDDSFQKQRAGLGMFFPQRFLATGAIFHDLDLQSFFIDQAAFQIIIRAVVADDPRLLSGRRR